MRKNIKDQITDIYMLGISFTKPGLYCVESDKQGFNEHRFYEGESIEDWPQGIVFVFDGGPKDDFLLGGLHWLLISESVRQVFIESKVKGVQYLPVKVVYILNNEEIGVYWAINVIQSVERLTWKFVDELDIFRRKTDIFISNRLKRKLEQRKATKGAYFTRMPQKILNRERNIE
jgi:hypothetical protein